MAVQHEAPTGAETRSIDWVPNEERTGTVKSMGAVWFVSNINLTAMATGITALSVGGSLFWTLVATVVGSLFGTFFMAFHSAQGPQLGLPQLVQSRPQFGYLGAAVSIFVFALVNYIAYNTSDALLSGGAMHELLHIPTSLGFPIAAAVAAVLAIYGYHWIHRINRWLAWPSIILMVVLSVAALANNALPAHAFSPGTFKLAPFMTVFVIIGGFQLGWAPYVSDYSRYLPARVSVRATFWWTYIPSGLSALWVFCLGAVIAAAAPRDATPVQAFKAAGNSLFNGFGDIAVVGLLIGLLAVMAINAYGGSLSMISIADSFRRITPSKGLRVGTIIAMGVIVWSISQFVGEDNFNKFYGNVLIFLAYIFTPWTAINLIDFFFVRRGVYVISEIFKPDGLYGRWGWRGLVSYVVGLAAMVPFFVTTPFTGWAAKSLSVDYSMFVGLPIAGGLYWLLSRGLDLRGEMRLARDEGVLDLHHIAHHLPDEPGA